MQDDAREGVGWFRAVVDSSYDAIIGKRLDGTIISWNPSAQQIYGYSATEAIGSHISLIVPSDRLNELDRIMTGLSRGEGLRGYETVRQRKDGSRIDVSLTISPVHDASGAVVGGSVLARDISDIKRTAQELLESRERLSVAVQAAKIGLFRWECATNRVIWDETLRALFGLQDGQAVFSLDDYIARVHPDDREDLLTGVRESMASGIEYEREYRVLLPDGEIRWLAAKAKPFHDSDGRPLYLTGACRDVTDRRRTQEALSSALEQKELLLGEINHRVKNSLQLASSLLQMQAGSGAPEEVRRALSEAGGRLITVARVHERLYHGAELQSVDLRDYLARLCDDLRESTAGGRSEIVTGIERLAVGADKAILVGLLVNELVTNALKHALPTGGHCEVRVECRRTAEGALLSVADNGRGLPEGFDVARSTSFGMRLVNAFASQLGGVLEVSSSPKGARFVLAFPADPAKA